MFGADGPMQAHRNDHMLLDYRFVKSKDLLQELVETLFHEHAENHLS